MKLFLKYMCIIALSLGAAFMLYNFVSYSGLDINDEKVDYSIDIKGISNVVDFDIYDDNQFLIAKNNCILLKKEDGAIKTLYTCEEGRITAMALVNRTIFMVENNKLISFNIDSNEKKEVINNIPIIGKNDECRLLPYKDKVLLSISSVTNSGIMENGQVSFGNEVYDRTPIDVYSMGSKFDKDETGVFCPKGKSYNKGEVIKGVIPANACILSIDQNTNVKIYASGIKKVEGWCIADDNKLYAAVGGMEEKGLRPVANDTDYIYEINEGEWLGWPDFSGGDPVTSPRFRVNDEKVSFVLDKHITENPKAPLYQCDKLNSISCMASAPKTICKDSGIIFYDKKDNQLKFFKQGIIPSKLIDAGRNCEIISIKQKDNVIYMLDGKKGVIYKIFEKQAVNNKDKNILLYFTIGLFMIGLIYIIFSLGKKQER